MVSLTGTHLRSIREQRGLTLLDAAHETRIPVQQLLWLEEEDFAAFANLTYARSFLKSYCSYLGVDAGEILQKLPSTQRGGTPGYGYLTENHGSWVLEDRRLAHHHEVLRRKRSPRTPVNAGIAIFVLMLIGTGIWGSHVAQERFETKAEPTLQTDIEVAKTFVSTKPEKISAHIKATSTDLPAMAKPVHGQIQSLNSRLE